MRRLEAGSWFRANKDLTPIQCRDLSMDHDFVYQVRKTSSMPWAATLVDVYLNGQYLGKQNFTFLKYVHIERIVDPEEVAMLTLMAMGVGA